MVHGKTALSSRMEEGMNLGTRIQSADWKSEKHVPVIECDSDVSANQPFEVKVSVGKEIAHPNTVEHHIRWVDVYFQPQGTKFVYQVGHFEFSAHGEAKQGLAFTHPMAVFSMTVTAPGSLIALSLCNIHGLWESSQEITVTE